MEVLPQIHGITYPKNVIIDRKIVITLMEHDQGYSVNNHSESQVLGH